MLCCSDSRSSSLNTGDKSARAYGYRTQDGPKHCPLQLWSSINKEFRVLHDFVGSSIYRPMLCTS